MINLKKLKEGIYKLQWVLEEQELYLKIYSDNFENRDDYKTKRGNLKRAIDYTALVINSIKKNEIKRKNNFILSGSLTN